MAGGNRFVQQRQIEVFDVHEFKLGVAALLCDLVNPFSYRLTVTTGPRAANDDGNLKHTFLHCIVYRRSADGTRSCTSPVKAERTLRNTRTHNTVTIITKGKPLGAINR